MKALEEEARGRKRSNVITKAISMPLSLARAAEKAAEEDQRSFSSYIQKLIAADTKKENEVGNG